MATARPDYKKLHGYFKNLGFEARSLRGQNFDKAFNRVYEYYQQNKDFIDEKLKGVRDPRKAFIHDVLSRMDENIGTKDKVRHLGAEKAIKKEMRTQTFMEYKDIAKENALNAIKSDPDAYALWRQFTRHQKIDRANFSYMQADGIYVYETKNWKIFIYLQNSPVEVKVWRERK